MEVLRRADEKCDAEVHLRAPLKIAGARYGWIADH